jgi:hypothetical protein
MSRTGQRFLGIDLLITHYSLPQFSVFNFLTPLGTKHPRVAIERGTPKGCGGTKQTEEYTDYKSVIVQLCFAIICLNSFYIGIYQSKFINCL